MIDVLPLLWKSGTGGELEPQDHGLLMSAEAFTAKEFGKPLEFRRYMKAWVLADIIDGVVKVRGVIALCYVVDCPVFHVEAPADESALAARDFARGYKALIGRAKGFLNDAGTVGTGVFVHVSDESTNATMLRHALDSLAAVPSNRVIVTI